MQAILVADPANSFDAWPMWLSVTLMILGVLLLGVLCILLLREAKSPPDTNASLQSAEDPTGGDPQLPIDAVVEAFQSCASQLQEQNARLQESLLRLEQRVHACESQALREDRPAHATSRRAHPVTSTEVKLNRPAGELQARLECSPLFRSVFELTDAGQTPVQIAQQLSENVGTVELILAMRKM